jgi:hypothetical protein
VLPLSLAPEALGGLSGQADGQVAADGPHLGASLTAAPNALLNLLKQHGPVRSDPLECTRTRISADSHWNGIGATDTRPLQCMLTSNAAFFLRVSACPFRSRWSSCWQAP